jgi:phospholipase C
MLENHTFDNSFGTFPGANGITLPQASNPLPSDYGHSREALIAALDGGKMDEFNKRANVQCKQSDDVLSKGVQQLLGRGNQGL